MKITCFIHAPFENPGMIHHFARQNKFELTEIHTYRGDALPSLSSFDLLIVLGGPQSAVHPERWPYLLDEISFIQNAIEKNKKVLGICLGAQLISATLGGKVCKNPEREIGFFPIQFNQNAKADPLFKNFSEKINVFHWHSDCIGLTPEIEILASSKACPYQIFKVNPNVYGLQCHLEMTKENIRDMVKHCGGELKPGPFVQTKNELLTIDTKQINEYMTTILNYFK